MQDRAGEGKELVVPRPPAQCKQPKCSFYSTALGLCSEHVRPLIEAPARLQYFRPGMPELRELGADTERTLLPPLWGLVGEYVGFVTEEQHNTMVRLIQCPAVIGARELEMKLKPFICEQAPATLTQMARLESNPTIFLSVMMAQKWLLSSAAAKSLFRIAQGRFQHEEANLHLWGCVIFCRVWCRTEAHMDSEGRHCCILHQQLPQPYAMSSPDEYLPTIHYHDQEWAHYLRRANAIVID